MDLGQAHGDVQEVCGNWFSCSLANKSISRQLGSWSKKWISLSPKTKSFPFRGCILHCPLLQNCLLFDLSPFHCLLFDLSPFRFTNWRLSLFRMSLHLVRRGLLASWTLYFLAPASYLPGFPYLSLRESCSHLFPQSRVATNEVLCMIAQLVLDYEIQAPPSIKSFLEIPYALKSLISPEVPKLEFVPRPQNLQPDSVERWKDLIIKITFLWFESTVLVNH